MAASASRNPKINGRFTLETFTRYNLNVYVRDVAVVCNFLDQVKLISRRSDFRHARI